MVYRRQAWSTGPEGATPLSAERLNYMEKGIADAHALAGGILLDSFRGSDDDRLTAALKAQQASPGMPPVVLGARNHSFNTTRSLYSGLKLVGARSSGPKNLELAGSNFVTSRVTLGSRIGSAERSWWVAPPSDVYDVFMSDFAVAGDAGASVHQFLDFPVGSGHTLFACEFRSLSFNFMRAAFGRKDRPCALTQVTFAGHWTALNFWETQFHLGGSDNNLWMGGQINIGCSASPRQTGTLGRGDYQMVMSSMSKTNVGYIYLTALNGWRGLRIVGSSGGGLFFYGGTYEGYRADGSRLSGPAPGTLIRIEGGSGAFYGPSIGQGMNDPAKSETGLVQMSAGEWSIAGASFYRGSMPEGVPCVAHTGGRMLVTGATYPAHEKWRSRPRFVTSAPGPTSGPLSFCCPDFSMVPA